VRTINVRTPKILHHAHCRVALTRAFDRDFPTFPGHIRAVKWRRLGGTLHAYSRSDLSRFEEMSMEITPDSSPAKRSRAKPVAKESAAAKPVAAKKPRAARKSATVEAADAAIVAATLEPKPEDVGNMIATTAYYLAAARNFTPGHELDDWLEAERLVHAKLYG
jgi:hypothetical protein